MLLISREERDYLEKQGCVWGDELHRTRSNKKTYYATETPKVKRLLADRRKSVTVK